MSNGMSAKAAREIHDRFLERLRAERSWLALPNWVGQRPIPTEEADAWLFWYTDPALRGQQGHNHEVVVVRKDTKEAFTLFGATGKVYFGGGFRNLGLPTSSEQWLGSGPGRYQTFDNGYILWDQLTDLGYPRVSGARFHPATVFGCVAFFDIRGFTTWSATSDPRQTQALMTGLETLFNTAFCEPWCGRLFVKGTGDGFMLVSEAGDFPTLDAGDTAVSARGHALAFLRACERFLLLAQQPLPAGLAVGCGLDCGPLQRLFLFGQRDYLAPQVNYAAKHQQLAWNEIVASARFVNELIHDGGDGPTIAQNAKGLGVDRFRLQAPEGL